MNDLRYALRMLIKSPAFSIIAIGALALGISANTAIFSVVNAVLIRPLPFPKSDRLVMLWQTNPAVKKMGFEVAPTSVPDFQDWRAQAKSFEAISAFESWTANLTGQDEPERLGGARVSANLMSLLRIQPILGRSFVEGEDQPGRNQVVILSSELWQRRFGGDPAIIGRKLILGEEVYTVIGVMPPRFGFPNDTGMPAYMTFDGRCEIWTPFAPSVDRAKNRGAHNLAVIGRLKPAASLTKTQTEMTNPIGQRFKGSDENEKPRPREIVGIVGDVRHSSLDVKPAPHIYLPHAQQGPGLMTVAVRSVGPRPAALLVLVRREIAAVDPNVPIADIRTMEQMVTSSVAPWRFTMTLLSVFAGVALLLASVGIYGVLAYSVNQRRREIGIRMSLGAQRRDVLQLFLSQGMSVTLAGIVIGLGSAWAATRIMHSLLYSVSPTDPFVFFAVAFGLTMVAFLASYFPARKATRVNPVVALRHE